MKLTHTLYITLLGCSITASAQVGINTTTPNASAALEISDTSRGVLIPRMTQAQRDAIASPATGLLIYQTNATPGFYYYDGAAWVSFAGGGSGWSLTGDSGTNPATNAVGTAHNQGLSIVTNNTEAVRISPNGFVGMGTGTPTAQLHLNTASNQTFTLLDGLQGNTKVLVSDAYGVGVWKPTPLAKTEDHDWIFDNGYNNLHSIYRTGNVKIGNSSPSSYNLHVTNGSTSGTRIYFGSVEYVDDAVNDFAFSHMVFPISSTSPNLGSSTKRWNIAYATGGVVTSSDERLKKDITPLNKGLNEVLQLKPVSFQWKTEKVRNLEVPQDQKETKLGFIAQEIQTVLPEIVKTKEWKEYEENPGVLVQKEMPIIGVSYSEMIPVVTKAIQEQNDYIIRLQEKANELEKLIDTLQKNKTEK